jgi:hypothetical protein
VVRGTVLILVKRKGLSPLIARWTQNTSADERVESCNSISAMPGNEALAAGTEIELPGDNTGEPRY